MPEQLQESFIKDLPEILNTNDLYPTHLEVEDSTGVEPVNRKVGFGTLVNGIVKALPGANNSKTLYKSVRCYSTDIPDYGAGQETLTGLNEEFLALGAIAWVEFPQPSREYRLVYSPVGPLNVWLSGNFANQKIPAKWVERDSLEDINSTIQDFSPFASSYASGDVVKFYLEGKLALFSARQTIVKSAFPDFLIPEPTGLSTDVYWGEINGPGLTTVKTWLKGSYKVEEIVVYNSQLFRAKRTFTSSTAPVAGADWEVLAGGLGGIVYDDTELRGRVGNLETVTDEIRTDLEAAKLELNARIDAIVAAATLWKQGSYMQGQFILSSGNVYMARQDIANSTVAPTSTNVYWLQVNGASYDDTQLRSLINGKVDKQSGYSLLSEAERTKLAGLQNYTLKPDSVTEPILSPEVRAKLNAATGGNPSELITVLGATETIGGVIPGDYLDKTNQEMWSRLLVKYQIPVFQSFTVFGGGSRTVEAGTSFAGPASFTWSTSNNQNIQPDKITIRDVSANSTLVANSANDGQESVAVSNFTLGLGQSKQYQIFSLDANGENFSSTLTISTALARYYGALSLTPAEFKAQLVSQSPNEFPLSKDLGTSLSLNNNYDCSGGKYIYYLYPADYPVPTTVQQGPNSFSAYTVDAITIRDVFGINRAYRILYTGYQTASNFNFNVIN